MTDWDEMTWLVLRAQSGDRPALERLLLDTQRRLSRQLTTMIGDPDAAADVMQESLVTIYRKLGDLQEPRAYLSWARRIAARAAMAHCRRSTRAGQLTPIEEVEHELESAGHDADAGAELLDQLPKLLDQVSPASREVLILHYLEGLTLERVAATLDLSMGTVKSRLAYGLRQMRTLTR